MAALLGFLGLTGATVASAHEGGSEAEGYVMVQQAIGYLMNMPEREASIHAQEKVVEALAAADQEGVSVDQLEQAQSALEAGHPDEARALLQTSITEAVTAIEPAKGVDTGTGTVLAPLAPSPASGLEWAFLAVSILAIAAGIWLAVLYRPRESVRELRRDMGLTAQHLGVRPDGQQPDGAEGETR